MKICYKNLITTINSMSGPSGLYPKANLVDKQPKRIAKTTATTTAICWTGNGTDLFLFNIRAETGRLRIVNNDATGLAKVTGTDLAITDSNTLTSVTTDLSVFSDGGTIVISGFENAQNNGVFTVSGAPTANALDVVGTPFTAEAATPSVTVVDATSPEIDDTLDFSWAESFTDYFAGRVRQVTQFYKDIANNWTSQTCILNLTISGTGRLGTEKPSLGLIYQGNARHMGQAQYGSGHMLRDSSIYRKTSNGSLVSVDRVVNTDMQFSVNCTLNEAQNLLEIYKNDNAEYKVYLFGDIDDLQESTFVYGKTEAPPQIIWQLPEQKRYSLTVTQIGGY
jgi:hypothetical protein